jgi:hypothetical protein
LARTMMTRRPRPERRSGDGRTPRGRARADGERPRASRRSRRRGRNPREGRGEGRERAHGAGESDAAPPILRYFLRSVLPVPSVDDETSSSHRGASSPSATRRATPRHRLTTSVSGEMRARVLNIAFALLALAILRASTPADAFNANYVNELLTAHAEEGYRDGGGGSGSGGEPKRVKIPVSTRGHIPDDWYSGEKSMDLHVGTLTVRRADATRGDARSLDRSIGRSVDRSVLASTRFHSDPNRPSVPFVAALTTTLPPTHTPAHPAGGREIRPAHAEALAMQLLPGRRAHDHSAVTRGDHDGRDGPDDQPHDAAPTHRSRGDRRRGEDVRGRRG